MLCFLYNTAIQTNTVIKKYKSLYYKRCETLVINGKEFFEKVKFDKTRSESTAVAVGANTLYGAVISLMESLHLSYSEAFEKIPYPQMLIMSADRLRALSPSEKVITQSSGKEMAARRRRRGK